MIFIWKLFRNDFEFLRAVREAHEDLDECGAIVPDFKVGDGAGSLKLEFDPGLGFTDPLAEPLFGGSFSH